MNTAVLCAIGPDKPVEVVRSVMSAIIEDFPDEAIFIFDRPSRELTQVSEEVCDSAPDDCAVALDLEGPPGQHWRSPAVVFNEGLKLVTADVTIVCHGDVEVAPGAVDTVLTLMAEKEAVYFAEVKESKPEECMGVGSAGPVLVSSQNARALTYLFAVPTKALKAIGGWDEAFSAGVCYEDDDLTARLWGEGLDFIFDDRLQGLHHSHSRAYFTAIRMAPNMALMLQKHGTREWVNRQRALGQLLIDSGEKRTVFSHGKHL